MRLHNSAVSERPTFLLLSDTRYDHIVNAARRTWLRYRVLLAASFGVAVASFIAPENRMPIDWEGILRFSVPLYSVWVVLVVTALIRYRKKGLAWKLRVKW